MKLHSDSFPNNTPIPGEFAFCIPADQGHVTGGANKSPNLAWSEVPDGTRSFAVICHDPDVPSKADDVNVEGRTIPAAMPRVDFYHWVLVDVPASVTELPVGADADGVTAKGKREQRTQYGVRGLNTYTDFLAGDPNMAGEYYGYDGPCPPWNDEILHHYVFTVYALDVDSLNLSGKFTGAQALEAMQGHVLGKAEWVGTYTLNPDVKS